MSEPINLALRLRHLFGLGARAECLRCLLTDMRTELSVADLASVAGYAKRNVADALRSLATAGVVIEMPSGNERRYRLDRRRWADFLQVDLAEVGPYRNWPALLRSLTLIDRWTAAQPGAMSDQLRASSARDLLERIGPDLAAAGVPLPPESRPGAGYLDGFWASVEAAPRAPRCHREPIAPALPGVRNRRQTMRDHVPQVWPRFRRSRSRGRPMRAASFYPILN